MAAAVLVCAMVFVGDTWFGVGGFCSDVTQLADHIEDDAGDVDAQVAEAEEHVDELGDRADRMVWPWPRGESQALVAELQLLAHSDAASSGEPGQTEEGAVAAYLETSEAFTQAHCEQAG